MNQSNIAIHWARLLGTDIGSLSQLKGGINNRVFVCGSQKNRWVIKEYPARKGGERDRMNAEVDFLIYAAEVAPGFTPMLAEVDKKQRCVVMEFIEGVNYREGVSPGKSDLEKAFSFFCKLNNDLEFAKSFIHMNAAESYLSLRQHMGNLLERLSVMEIEHLPREYKKEAGNILCELHAKAEDAVQGIEEQIRSGMVRDAQDEESLCVSPSDYGFHNAIRSTNGVVFIDFEFAGWDDPVKTCIDFVLQQRVPIPLGFMDVASRFFPGKEKNMNNRIIAMAEILRLKWLCIILGVLNPVKLTRMVGDGHGLTEELAVSIQLKRYNEYAKRHSCW